MPKPTNSNFQWDDPLLLNDQLSEEERLIRDSVRHFTEETLQPKVIAAFRNGTQLDSAGFMR